MYESMLLSVGALIVLFAVVAQLANEAEHKYMLRQNIMAAQTQTAEAWARLEHARAQYEIDNKSQRATAALARAHDDYRYWQKQLGQHLAAM